jgi:chromosomal replication initiator protein
MNKQLNYWVRPAVTHTTDVQTIIDNVCLHYGITEELLKKKSRFRTFVDARNIVMYICRMNLKISLQDIANIFGMNHSTVIHGINKVENLKDFDSDFKELINRFV